MNVTLLVEPTVSLGVPVSGFILAYIGPGAGLAAFGPLLTVIGVAVLTIFGLIWYPVRQALRKLRAWRKKEIPAIKNDPGKQAESGEPK